MAAFKTRINEQGRLVIPAELRAATGIKPGSDVVIEECEGEVRIRSVDAAGRINAAYLNPRPINVAKAEATRDGSTLKVFVELQAPGYPGSTYTLTYDPKSDQLGGVYYQPSVQQRFDVSFVRTK